MNILEGYPNLRNVATGVISGIFTATATSAALSMNSYFGIENRDYPILGGAILSYYFMSSLQGVFPNTFIRKTDSKIMMIYLAALFALYPDIFEAQSYSERFSRIISAIGQEILRPFPNLWVIPQYFVAKTVANIAAGAFNAITN